MIYKELCFFNPSFVLTAIIPYIKQYFHSKPENVQKHKFQWYFLSFFCLL